MPPDCHTRLAADDVDQADSHTRLPPDHYFLACAQRLKLLDLHKILRHGGKIKLPRRLKPDPITQDEIAHGVAAGRHLASAAASSALPPLPTAILATPAHATFKAVGAANAFLGTSPSFSKLPSIAEAAQPAPPAQSPFASSSPAALMHGSTFGLVTKAAMASSPLAKAVGAKQAAAAAKRLSQRNLSQSLLRTALLTKAEEAPPLSSVPSNGGNSAPPENVASYLLDVLSEKGAQPSPNRPKASTSRRQINRKQFRQALADFGLDLGAGEESELLFSSLDKNGAGVVEMDDLHAAISFILDPRHDTDQAALLQSAAASLPAGLIELFGGGLSSLGSNPIERLRNSLEAQGGRVIELFRKWDVNGDGQISKKEFRAALPELGFTACTESEVSDLFDMFDADKSGEISFRELHKMLRKPLNALSNRSKAKPSPPPEVLDVDACRQQMKRHLLTMSVQQEMKTKTTADPYAGLLG